MSFTVRLETDHLTVDAGQNTPLTIEVANRGEATDQFELEIEGLDPEWTAVPVPTFSVPSGEVQRAKIFFKPERSSENVAGAFPFVVRVRSLESGEIRTAQGMVQIKPYFHLTMELDPRKGSFSPTSHQNVFTASIVNLGNCELTLQLFGSDPEDALAYEFSQDQITVGPGQQREVQVIATPTQKRAFSTPRLHGYTISARGVDHPGIVAAAQAQLEQKPLLSPGSLVALVLLFVLAFGWYFTLPKPPVIETFAVNRNTIERGESVTLSWRTANTKNVRLVFGSEELVTNGRPNGDFTFRPTVTGEVRLFAVRDGRTSLPQTLSVEVREPKQAPAAEIQEFSVSSRSVEPGQRFMVRYRVTNAVKISLLPMQQLLDPTVDSIQIEAPEQPGTYKYQISAVNASGSAVQSREIAVSVSFQPKAVIRSFVAEPEQVDEAVAKTTLKWATRDAEKCELKVGGQLIPLPTVNGQMEIDVFQSGTVELIAYDARGLTVRRSVRIRLVKSTPPPPVDDANKTNPPPVTDEQKTAPPPTASGGSAPPPR